MLLRSALGALFSILALGAGCAQSATSAPDGGGGEEAGAGAMESGDASIAADTGRDGAAAGTPTADSGPLDGAGAGPADSGRGAIDAVALDGSSPPSDATVADGSAGCQGLPLCDDFESDTLGGAPSAALWSIVAGKGCSGSSAFSITIDNTQHKSGSQSVKVTGGDSCGPLMLNASAFSGLGGEVYGRFYTWFSIPAPVHHVAVMALGFEPDAGPLGNNTKEYLQFSAEEIGGANGTNEGMLDWNYNDLTLPQKDTQGFAQTTYPVTDAWTCVEFHASAATGAIETWINGAAVAGMTYVPGTTMDVQGVNGGWNAGKPTLDVQSIGFGWVDFSSSNNSLWFDDVAIAGARIGCN